MSGSIFSLFKTEDLACRRKTSKGTTSDYKDFTVKAIVKRRCGWKSENNGEIIDNATTLHTRPNALKLNDLVEIDGTWQRVSSISRGRDFTASDEFDRVVLGSEGLEIADEGELEW